jgi:preprotein translocase subunit SecA
MGLLTGLFKSYSEKEVNRIIPIADKVVALEEEYEKLSDEELKSKTAEFKMRLEDGETLDDILVEAFAVVKEASGRVLGMKHYKEQIIGGVVLHQGRISEMKTGEGKTLVATLPAYLNALAGEGVHIITVNDYLASRDKDWMGKVYEFLGLTTGVIVHGINNEQRRAAYGADITYGTNNEFGFDYLRDNMVIYKEERVQRKLNFCVVDEVDSILIDEARTPLIISGAGEKSTEFYKVADYFVKTLRNEEDYTVDPEANAAMLTEEGIHKAEKTFKIDNYADADNMSLQHYVTQALKANCTMKRDKDYMVKDGEVIIVDEFTGRLMEGRRYSDGLHQAIEAKEGVKIERESKTLATITFQNYFRMYKKLSGMTGTALTEENEFREIYGLDVILIPTHKEIKRVDNTDLIYKNEKGKFNAIVEEIAETYKTGQPVLVGTISIEKSEALASVLKRKGVPHKVLNAKYHEQEAEIIASAGELGTVTIATNMAGRGTDIKLGEGVVEVGGLKIIGTERHESRRIDNQLRGRSGRQGDPGESKFYICLEDELMRRFGSERIQNIVEKLGLEDDDVIENKLITKQIENAQKKVEGNNFNIRKTLLGYDDVMNMQREVIYSQRSDVLEGEDLKEQIMSMAKEVITNSVSAHLNGVEEDDAFEAEVKKLIIYLDDLCIPSSRVDKEELLNLSNDEITAKYLELATEIYEAKEAQFSSERMREIERVILLRNVDSKWMDHIDNMDHLKQGIGLRAFKQQDPVQAYQMEGSEMFEEMIENIRLDTVRYIFHVQMEKAPERERIAEETVASHAGAGDGESKAAKKEPIRKKIEIGRNEPCTCGSGKKYKNCCGREV